MNTDTTNENIERLVDTLMFAFRIPKDDSLINILGSSYGKTNQDALREWIKNKLFNPDLQIAESILPILIERLEHVVNTEN